MFSLLHSGNWSASNAENVQMRFAEFMRWELISVGQLGRCFSKTYRIHQETIMGWKKKSHLSIYLQQPLRNALNLFSAASMDSSTKLQLICTIEATSSGTSRKIIYPSTANRNGHTDNAFMCGRVCIREIKEWHHYRGSGGLILHPTTPGDQISLNNRSVVLFCQ